MAAGDPITAVIIRPPARDNFGDPLPGSATRTDWPGCVFAPGPSQELNDAAAQVVSDGTVYGPPGEPGTTIRPTDRIEVRGDTYEVIGAPQNWGSAGIVVVLRRATG